MRIVHIIGGGDTGGAKTHVLYLLKELSRHMEVKLISLRPGVFADDARAMGIDVTVVKSGNIFSDIRKVTKMIADGGFDVVHSHGAKANMFSLLARRKAALPTVTTVHSDYRLDYMHSLPKRLTIGLMNSVAIHFIDNYVAVSGNFKEMLINRKFNPADIYVLYNGMDFSTPADKFFFVAIFHTGLAARKRIADVSHPWYAGKFLLQSQSYQMGTRRWGDRINEIHTLIFCQPCRLSDAEYLPEAFSVRYKQSRKKVRNILHKGR